MNKRSSTRYTPSRKQKVFLYHNDTRLYTCVTKDFSTTGAFLFSDKGTLMEGTKVKLTFPIDDGVIVRLITKTATIRRTVDGGMGLEFNTNPRFG